MYLSRITILLLFLVAVPAHAIQIDFEDLPVGAGNDAINAAYEPFGVSFTAILNGHFPSSVGIKKLTLCPNGSSCSAPSVTNTLLPVPGSSVSIEARELRITFLTPVSWASGRVLGESISTIIRAFDIDDHQVGQTLLTDPVSIDDFWSFTASSSSIRTIRLADGISSGGVSLGFALDVISFTQLPEPSSLALVACSLGALLVGLQRSRTGRA